MSEKSNELYLKILALEKEGVSQRKIAARLGIAPSTVLRHLQRGRAQQRVKSKSSPPSDLPILPPWNRQGDGGGFVPQAEGLDGLLFDSLTEEPIEALIARQTDTYHRKTTAAAKRRLAHIRVPDGLPIGLCHMGDPHLDDDGCAWPELLRTVETISKTEGMYAGCVGDLANNWVGRLEKLYKHQAATIEDATRLQRWFVKSLPWAYMILGNHDHWNQSAYLIRSMLEGVQVPAIGDHEIRLEIDFGKFVAKIIGRHYFRGRSQWNKVHGAMKALKLDPWAHVAVQGHVHIHALHQETSADGKHVTNAIIVRGYKELDDYAEALGLYTDPFGHSATTIIDPTAPHTERIRVVWDVEEAAALLTWLRERRR
jgi:hypothetical protein